MVDRTLDFAEEHPEAAAEYARSGKADLPNLGDESEVERCGDPEELLERLAESSD